MKNRVLTPELLDSLSADDPAAIRSRRDIRLINTFMRGEEWILQELSNFPDINQVVELGAGEGWLTKKIYSRNPNWKYSCVDIAPRPDGLPDDIEWHQTRVENFELEQGHQTAVIANLFMHHLDDEALVALQEKYAHADLMLFSEPHRSQRALRMSKFVIPLINQVTTHDMRVSIEAGFIENELPALLGTHHDWSEEVSFFGGIRVKGIRR